MFPFTSVSSASVQRVRPAREMPCDVDVIRRPTLEVEVAEPETFNPDKVVVPKPLPATETNFVAFDEEAISKSGVVCVVVACTERFARGEVVPKPRRPVAESQKNCVLFDAPNRTEEEANRFPVKSTGEEVAAVVTPK